MAKVNYSEKAVADWSTNDFIAYLADEHKRLYGTDYLPPGRKWQVERGLIGTLIGTKGKNAKPRKYPPEMLKRFIDECYRSHKLNGYSGVNFTFLWTYKTELWQRIQLEAMREDAAEADTVADIDDDWL
jgi:hypothetical protein